MRLAIIITMVLAAILIAVVILFGVNHGSRRQEVGDTPSECAVVSISSADGIVFFSDSSGNVYALDSVDMEVIWRRPCGTDARTYDCSTDVVTVLRSDRILLALSAVYGTVLWELDTGLFMPYYKMVDNVILYQGRQSPVRAVDTLTGQSIWQSDKHFLLVPPVFTRNGIWATDGPGKQLVCIDPANGRVLSALEADIYRDNVYAHGETLYYSSGNELYAVNAETGAQKVLFHRSIFPYPAPRSEGTGRMTVSGVTGKHIFVHYEGTLYAWNVGNQKVSWESRELRGYEITPFAIICCTGWGPIRGICNDTGEEMWRLNAADRIRVADMLDDAILVGLQSGELLAVDARTGVLKCTYAIKTE